MTQTNQVNYPVIKCKESHLSFYAFGFPVMFSIAFGSMLAFVIFIALASGETEILMVGIPYFLTALVPAIFAIRNYCRYKKVFRYGTEVEGIVCGYENDLIFYNHRPGQICWLLVPTYNGYAYIRYRFKSRIRPFPVNSRIPVQVYNDYYFIDTNTR